MMFAIASNCLPAAPIHLNDERVDRETEVDICIRQRLADCPYRFCFRNVEWEYDDATLRLYGRVPTFYLKQVLQTILRGIDHVDELINEVDVVSATGLSTVAAR